MSIPKDEMAQYAVNRFDEQATSFWMGRLEDSLTRYPWLEVPHRPSFYMLLCAESAGGTVTVDRHSRPLDPALITCIQPNSILSLNMGSGAGGRLICFTEGFFSLRYNNNVLRRFAFLKKGGSDCIRLGNGQWEKWRILLQLMEEEYQRGLGGTEKVLRSYLNVLLFDLDRACVPVLSEPGGAKEEWMIRFEHQVEENYHEHKNPSFYAAQLNITTNYLNKLCRKLRGRTSGEVIRDRIILEAQRLLHHTALSVAEIGFKLGFENPSYFVTFFKKQTDLTPETFRRHHS